MRAALASVALALAAACTADEPGFQVPPQLAGLPMSELAVETASGTHRFQVWIAADPASRERGLMQVRALPADHGMLFLFERAQYTSFWMKDTPLALDLAFVASDGTVVSVKPGIPLSLNPIDSPVPVQGVLELEAGTAARIGLGPGSVVDHPAFLRD